MPKVVPCADLQSPDYDCLVVVTDTIGKLTGSLQPLANELNNQAKVSPLLWFDVLAEQWNPRF